MTVSNPDDDFPFLARVASSGRTSFLAQDF